MTMLRYVFFFSGEVFPLLSSTMMINRPLLILRLSVQHSTPTSHIFFGACTRTRSSFLCVCSCNTDFNHSGDGRTLSLFPLALQHDKSYQNGRVVDILMFFFSFYLLLRRLSSSLLHWDFFNFLRFSSLFLLSLYATFVLTWWGKLMR